MIQNCTRLHRTALVLCLDDKSTAPNIERPLKSLHFFKSFVLHSPEQVFQGTVELLTEHNKKGGQCSSITLN